MERNYDKCCFNISRAAIYVLNLLFWMLGAGLIGLGVWLHLTNDGYLVLAPGYSFLTPSALFIAPGCLSILVGFLGCCGAVTENRCMITSYCILAVLVIILQVAAGVTAFVGEAQLTKHVEEQLTVSLKERYPVAPYQTEQAKHYVDGWDKLHQEFECCGVDSYEDWYKTHGWPTEEKVPDSCCLSQYVNCGTTKQPNNWYNQGCMVPLSDFISKHLCTIAVTTMTFAGIQVLAVIGAVLFLVFHRRKSVR